MRCANADTAAAEGTPPPFVSTPLRCAAMRTTSLGTMVELSLMVCTPSDRSPRSVSGPLCRRAKNAPDEEATSRPTSITPELRLGGKNGLINLMIDAPTNEDMACRSTVTNL
jgi:hypothetical protein